MRPNERPAALSPGILGVNRLVDQAQPGQAAAAFDVLANDGDVRRRPAIRAIACGAPFALPRGRVGRVDESSTEDPQATVANGTGAIHVGFLELTNDAEQFDGILWPDLTHSLSLTENHSLLVEYWAGGDWAPMPRVLDFTRDLVGDYFYPLVRRGLIAWVRPTGWVSSTIQGERAFWARLQVLDESESAVGVAEDLVLEKPGIRIFQLGRVTGLASVAVTGAETLTVTSALPRGESQGSQVGIVYSLGEGTIEAPYVFDQGPGVIGQVTYPEPLKDGSGNGAGTSAGPGAAGVLEKLRTQQEFEGEMVPFEWSANQFVGATRLASVAAAAPYDTVQLDLVTGDYPDGWFEHFRLRVAVAGSTSLVVGTVHEVVTSLRISANNNELVVDPPLGDTPDAATRFDLLAPPFEVLLRDETLSDRYEVRSNTEERITFEPQDFSASPPASWSGHYAVRRALRWMSESESFTIDTDPVTGRLILANGGDLLEGDGISVRRLRADRTSSLARQLVGESFEDALPFDPSPLAKTTLRGAPPPARYVAFFQNRVVLAGIRGRPHDVVHSYPGSANNVWPLVFQSMIRDRFQDPITGVGVLNERLVAFTRTAIHEGASPDSRGKIAFEPIAQGIGFVDQRAVATVIADESMLVGVSPDGISLWSGAQPIQVLDRWDRVLPDGVNAGALGKASAAALPEQNLVFFAVPSSGSGVCDRVLVWDYVADTFYPWRVPRGVSAMAMTTTIGDQQRLLIGTEDGFICALVDETTEDEGAIDGWVRTLPFDALAGQEVAPTRFSWLVRVLGAGQEVRLRMYTNDAPAPRIEAVNEVNEGNLAWLTDTWSSQSAAGRTWGGDTYLPIEAYARGVRGRRIQTEVGGLGLWRARTPELYVQGGPARGRK
jgi:hypothetical protein